MYLLIVLLGLWSFSDAENRSLSSNAITQRFSTNNQLQNEVMKKLQLELCPFNQQMVRNVCVGICCYDLNSKYNLKYEKISTSSVNLVCCSHDLIIINWPLLNHTKNYVYLVEITESVTSLKNFNVTLNNTIAFNNLKENSSYKFCVSLFESSYEIVKYIECKVFVTLPKKHTYSNVTKVWLEKTTRGPNNDLIETVKWNPTKDSSCYYQAAVFVNERFFMQVDVMLPNNTIIIDEVEYNSSIKVRVAATNLEKNKEGPPSWLNHTSETCMEFNNNSLYHCAPESPKSISVSETELKHDSENDTIFYDVSIKWRTPEYTPNFYLVNITNDDKNIVLGIWNISGIKTTAKFEALDIRTSYEINMTAYSHGGQSKPSFANRKIVFRGPPDDEVESSSLLWTTLVPIFICVFVISTVVIIYLRRLKNLSKRRCRYFDDIDRKFTKEIDNRTGFTVHLEDDPFEIYPNTLVLAEVLGEGAFGIVRKGWIPEKGREVAVKMLKDESSVEEIKQFRQEINMMKSVGTHAHIVSLVGCCTRPERSMMLVVEFCPCGDLLNYLRHVWDAIIYKSPDKPLPLSDMMSVNDNDVCDLIIKPKYNEMITSKYSVEQTMVELPHQNFIANKLYDLQQSFDMKDGEADTNLTSVDLLSFGRQIAMGMEYLSSNRVVHRDLAARNVLVCSNKTVKISDFGLSRDIYRENIYKKIGVGKLPVKWMAVESLTHQVYTTQSDVWSYGILLWEIVTLGGNPYPGIPSSSLLKLLSAGYRMERPTNCSQDIYSLMMNCWQCRPKDRPTFTEIRKLIDTILEGMCPDTYLTLNISNYKHLLAPGTYDSDQSTKFDDDVCNGCDACTACESCKEIDICDDSASDRYVKPIIVDAAHEITSKKSSEYCNQQFPTLKKGFL